MLKYIKPKTTNSTEEINRVEKFFGKKIQRFELNPYIRKFKMDSLEVEVLLELDYQSRIYHPLITSYQEISAYMCRTEKSIKRAMEQLESYGIITMKTVQQGKGFYKLITFLVDLQKSSDKTLSGEIERYEHKIASTRARKLTEENIEEYGTIPQEVVQEEKPQVQLQAIPEIIQGPEGLWIHSSTGEIVHNPDQGIYHGYRM